MKTITILVLSVLILSGCSGDLVDTRVKEINSGTYKVSGTQVKLKYKFPWGEDAEVLSRDTTQIEFMVEIEYPRNKTDTVRFEGLEGANSGEYQAVNRNCTHPSCYADAKLSDSELMFELSGAGGYYSGEGFLGAETLVLETHFQYRGEGIDYHLQGEKVEE